MILTDYQLLAYLHDGKCRVVTWDCRNSQFRTLRLRIGADKEAGYPDWDGKEIEVTLTDVVAFSCFGLGHVLGDENIDSWRVGVSASFDEECVGLSKAGISLPPLRFTISFRSGSFLEVACGEVSVEVDHAAMQLAT